jgi:5'-nucleotidase
MSGASHSLTLARPLRIRQLDERHWAIDGTPTDCVTLASTRSFPKIKSHTSASPVSITAAISATMRHTRHSRRRTRSDDSGRAGVALSLVARDNFNFEESAAFAVVAARKVLDEGLPEGTLLNINIPPGEIKGVKVTRQGIKNARPVITEHIDPRGKPYFWIGEEYFNVNSVEGTDYHAVANGYVSVTPLRSDMTDHNALTALETWNYLKDSELLQKS